MHASNCTDSFEIVITGSKLMPAIVLKHAKGVNAILAVNFTAKT